MLIYQVRPRIFRFAASESPALNWPIEATLHFYFQPPQPFGMAAAGGRTAVRGVAATSYFNANTGVHSIESAPPLTPLKVVLYDPDRTFSLDGNVLATTQTFACWEALNATIESIYFGLPVLLNVTFADAPFVERVEGTAAGQIFRWELSEWNMDFQVTTQTLQETKVSHAWQRMSLLAKPEHRLLLAALHYFHVACRLDRMSATPGEFLPEVLLNLAKTLESLFPPSGEGTSMKAARSGLRKLGIEDEEIERKFVPAIALRNHVGVGHVVAALFTQQQLKILHAYTERAQSAFRDLLDKIIKKIESGDLEMSEYELHAPPASVTKIIDRLGEAQAGDE